MSPVQTKTDDPVHLSDAKQKLAALQRALAEVERTSIATAQHSLPFGLHEIERHLPGAGLACGAVHELAAAVYSDRPAAFGFASAATAQAQLAADHERLDPDGLAHLIDRLEQRLGTSAVRRFHPRGSHIPESAVVEKRAVDGAPLDWAIGKSLNARPVQLLRRPEEVGEVMALIPEGPPRRFRWRGVLHQVTHADGPERIAPEWWRREQNGAERDYYVVEDESGRRFWLFRSGLYRDESVAPRWFVHGVFA